MPKHRQNQIVMTVRSAFEEAGILVESAEVSKPVPRYPSIERHGYLSIAVKGMTSSLVVEACEDAVEVTVETPAGILTQAALPGQVHAMLASLLNWIRDSAEEGPAALAEAVFARGAASSPSRRLTRAFQ